jgi:hypothetical protein
VYSKTNELKEAMRSQLLQSLFVVTLPDSVQVCALRLSFLTFWSSWFLLLVMLVVESSGYFWFLALQRSSRETPQYSVLCGVDKPLS